MESSHYDSRQIMQKCSEQQRDLITFPRPLMAFDCVNRELLFEILCKLGFPSKSVCIYSDVHARLIIDGELSKPVEYNSGVKQSINLSPTPFGIYAAALLLLQCLPKVIGTLKPLLHNPHSKEEKSFGFCVFVYILCVIVYILCVFVYLFLGSQS